MKITQKLQQAEQEGRTWCVVDSFVWAEIQSPLGMWADRPPGPRRSLATGSPSSTFRLELPKVWRTSVVGSKG